MYLVNQGYQNAVFCDGEYFYRFAHRRLAFPRFRLRGNNMYYPFEEQCSLDAQSQCERLLGKYLCEGMKKHCEYVKCVEIKPKSPVIYRGRELFDYTRMYKQIDAPDVQFSALELLRSLAQSCVSAYLLQKMGRYCYMQQLSSLDRAAYILNSHYVAQIACCLLLFYEYYNALNIDLDEFEDMIRSDAYEEYFDATEALVYDFLDGKPIYLVKTIEQRYAVFYAMKSISDASIIAWDGGAELVDLEMKSMRAKWHTWRYVYGGHNLSK